MREILFRGKDIKGNWHIGLLAHIGNAWYISNKAGIATAFEVIPSTIGQYTGLTDKNGKNIFEGDIVKGKDNLERNLAVGGYIDHENGSFVIVGEFMTHYRWLDYELEVIGNIYDNKEILDVK